MNQEPQYFTQKLLEDYLSSHCQNGGDPLSFPEALQHMRDEGLFLSDGTPKVIPRVEMDRETFLRAYENYPVSAMPILNMTEESYFEQRGNEESVFPADQSILCQKLLPGIYRQPQELSFFVLQYVCEGKATLNLEGDSFQLKEGDLCVLPPKAPHSLSVPMGSVVLSVILRASNFDSRFGELLTMSGVFFGFFRESLYGKAQPNFLMLHTKPGDSAVDYTMRGLMAETLAPDKHSWSCSTCWTKLMLSSALRSCGEKVEIYRFPTGGNPRADCGEILQYIQQNYRTVRLSTLAQQFHYNETYLSRMLQNYAHQSFTEIVRDIRMNRAVEYLNNSSLRVHEIAALVGYSSVDHFSRAFKAQYGVSPQSYRREKRK